LSIRQTTLQRPHIFINILKLSCRYAFTARGDCATWFTIRFVYGLFRSYNIYIYIWVYIRTMIIGIGVISSTVPKPGLPNRAKYHIILYSASVRSNARYLSEYFPAAKTIRRINFHTQFPRRILYIIIKYMPVEEKILPISVYYYIILYYIIFV